MAFFLACVKLEKDEVMTAEELKAFCKDKVRPFRSVQ
jgi:hypothetical protein